MNLTIKDLPARLHRKLKERAQVNKRSLNMEVIDILDYSLETKPVDMDVLLNKVQQIHDRLHLPDLTQEILDTAKNEGRP